MLGFATLATLVPTTLLYGLHGVADVSGFIVEVDLVLAFGVHLVRVHGGFGVGFAPGGVEPRRLSLLRPAAMRELVSGSAMLGKVHACSLFGISLVRDTIVRVRARALRLQVLSYRYRKRAS